MTAESYGKYTVLQKLNNHRWLVRCNTCNATLERAATYVKTGQINCPCEPRKGEYAIGQEVNGWRIVSKNKKRWKVECITCGLIIERQIDRITGPRPTLCLHNGKTKRGANKKVKPNRLLVVREHLGDDLYRATCLLCSKTDNYTKTELTQPAKCGCKGTA